MPKAILALVCLFALNSPAFALDENDNGELGDAAAWEEDAKAFIAQDSEEDADSLIQTIQWKGGSRGRVWTCFARSHRSGRTFSGQSTNANTARRIALNRCFSRSNSCSIRSCR